MKIDEQDIFNYVFFPKSIEIDKKKAIEEDENLTESIDFYREMLADSRNSPSGSLREKIAAKISAYSPGTEIYLYPLGVIPETKMHVKRLAADSESRNLISKLMSKTFADKEKEYMIKVINYEETTKVFVFSAHNEIVKDFDIVVEPHKLRYHFKDSSQPLLIERIVEIDSIRLEFSK